jgi:hypothetical protein
MKKNELALIIIWLLTIQAVSAGVISLTTTITTGTMTEKATKTNVKLLNSGDETAYNVQVSLVTDYFNTSQVYVGNLDPNTPFEGNLNITRKKEILPGIYPLVVLTDYSDANGYPFSSISPSNMIYKTNTVSKVSGVFSELSLSGKESKKLSLTTRNLDSMPHELKVKLILPRELKAVNDNGVLSVGSKEEKKLDFDVSSFSALAGSSYVVLASLEYDDNNLHYSSFAQTIVKITEEKSSLSLNLPSWFPILIVIALIAVFLYYQFRKGKKE